jgi:Flp pilus assembly CpaE family ATPase
MTRFADPDTGQKSMSIMVVTQRDAFSQCMAEIFPADDKSTITKNDTTFKAMNGHAAELAFNHDVVIFDADPEDKGEVAAIKDLLSHRANGTVFLALTDNDVSISQARQLRDIGVDEVLPLSITGESLKAVIDEQLETHKAPAHQTGDGAPALGKVIAVTQARGGIGATTLAVNLACQLVGKSTMFHKSQKMRVALLDFDIQFGNVNVFLDLEDNGGFLQMIEAVEEPDAHFLDSVLQKHALGVDVLCAPAPIAPLQSVRPDAIAGVLDVLQQHYDYVVVDFPRALVDWVEPVLKRATRLVMVTDTTVPCVRQARRLIDFYREENVGLPVEVVVNREKRPLLKSEHVREAEKVLKTKLTHWLPDNPKLARKAADLGQPVIEIKAGSDLGKALTKLAAELKTDSKPAQRTNA